MIKVYVVFFILFLQGIRIISGVTLDKLSPFLDKTETLKFPCEHLFLMIFSILVLLLDKLVLGIELDLSTVFSMSVILEDIDLSIDLTLSVLLLLGVSTVLLDAFDFSILLTVPILFFA